MCICRFLKARKFDLDKTVLMWSEMLNWRREYGVDSIIRVKFYTLLSNRICFRDDEIMVFNVESVSGQGLRKGGLPS